MTTSDGYELTATKRPAPTCTAMDEDGERCTEPAAVHIQPGMWQRGEMICAGHYEQYVDVRRDHGEPEWPTLEELRGQS